MKIVNTKKQPMTENITIRLQKESMKMIASLAQVHKVSKMLIVNRIVEKSLKDPKFEIEL
jgi:hypothetical protein